MLSDHCPVFAVLSVLSICPGCDIGVFGHTVGWIKMKLGTEVGFGPGHIVLDGDPAPPNGAQSPNFQPMFVVSPQRGAQQPPLFGHVYCGQTGEWIKLPLDVEVGIGPGDTVLDGDPDSPMERGIVALSHFSAHVYCG